MSENLSSNGSSFLIIPPTKEQDRYRYRIRVAGMDYNANLTYELPRKSEDRTILLVNVSRTFPFITSEDEAEYNRLIDRIRETSGRFAGVKNIVNRLAENEFANLPNVRIAVHKFGPVPVYLLPQKYTISYLGDHIEAQIGVYPDLKAQKSRDKGGRSVNLLLPFLASKTEFVRSLSVGLGLMFQRYLEDIGEGMYDIKHHLDLAGVFNRAKEIETILAESIKSKLDVAIPSVQVFKYPNSTHEEWVKELFEREGDWIFTARYARQYALYFLNELYEIIGIEPRSDYYLKGFKQIQQQFDALLGPGYMRRAIGQLPQVARLSSAIRAYKDNDYDTLRDVNVHGEPLWIRRFVQFARFIAALNQERLKPITGRIFISYHHDVPVTEILRKQINDYISSQFPNRVEVLSVRETGAGVKFKSPIRARIWLSDTVSGIVPKNTAVISGDKDKDYLWVAREAEYGLLLGKRVIYLVENGVDENRVQDDLKKKNRDGLIPSTARVPDWLEKKLIESFTEYTRAVFSVRTTGANPQLLDPNVREIINQEAYKALERRHQDIILGFYNQFPESTRLTLKHIQQVVPYPLNAIKANLVDKLRELYPHIYPTEQKATKAITNTWELAKERALLINDQPMRLMRLIKHRRYTGNLREILKRLRPDLSQEEIQAWEQKIFVAVVREDDSV